MTGGEDGRPDPGPAELFEQFFGPTIFAPWTRVLLEHAEPRPSEEILDLACATGTVARQTAPVVQDDGRVVGLDIDPDMFGDADRLTDLMNGAGFDDVEVTERTLDVEFPDPDTFAMPNQIAMGYA